MVDQMQADLQILEPNNEESKRAELDSVGAEFQKSTSLGALHLKRQSVAL